MHFNFILGLIYDSTIICIRSLEVFISFAKGLFFKYYDIIKIYQVNSNFITKYVDM